MGFWEEYLGCDGNMMGISFTQFFTWRIPSMKQWSNDFFSSMDQKPMGNDPCHWTKTKRTPKRPRLQWHRMGFFQQDLRMRCTSFDGSCLQLHCLENDWWKYWFYVSTKSWSHSFHDKFMVAPNSRWNSASLVAFRQCLPKEFFGKAQSPTWLFSLYGLFNSPCLTRPNFQIHPSNWWIPIGISTCCFKHLCWFIPAR